MATVQNFEVMFDKFNVDSLFLSNKVFFPREDTAARPSITTSDDDDDDDDDDLCLQLVVSRDSSVSIVTGYGLGYRMKGFDSRRGLGIFFVTASGPALRSTQPPYPVGNGNSYTGRGVKLTTHFHLVPRLRMRGAMYFHFHNTSSWGGS
jgi:hypothetical protein